MTKKYSIRVPLYASPIEFLSKINKSENIAISIYGGVPNSPLNGGRYNSGLDGLVLKDRLFLNITQKHLTTALASFYKTIAKASQHNITQKHLTTALASFYKTITKANQHNISFYIAFTNMFVSQEELNEENLYPVRRLVESSEKYGVKNGLILTNKLLENHIRQKYGPRLLYTSSCTKYVSPHKILTPEETLSMYREDDGKYDCICLTQQDSRRGDLLKAVLRDSKSSILAISNSYCSDTCNSYHHIKDVSDRNKKSLLNTGAIELVSDVQAFMLPRLASCPAMRFSFLKLPVKKIAAMQLNAGITNFKLGRDPEAAKAVDDIVSLILRAQKDARRAYPRKRYQA